MVQAWYRCNTDVIRTYYTCSISAGNARSTLVVQMWYRRNTRVVRPPLLRYPDECVCALVEAVQGFGEDGHLFFADAA